MLCDREKHFCNRKHTSPQASPIQVNETCYIVSTVLTCLGSVTTRQPRELKQISQSVAANQKPHYQRATSGKSKILAAVLPYILFCTYGTLRVTIRGEPQRFRHAQFMQVPTNRPTSVLGIAQDSLGPAQGIKPITKRLADLPANQTRGKVANSDLRSSRPPNHRVRSVELRPAPPRPVCENWDWLRSQRRAAQPCPSWGQKTLQRLLSPPLAPFIGYEQRPFLAGGVADWAAVAG